MSKSRLIYNGFNPSYPWESVVVYEKDERLFVEISDRRVSSHPILLGYAVADISRVSNDIINKEKYIKFVGIIHGIKIKNNHYPLSEIRDSGIIPPLTIKRKLSDGQYLAIYYIVLSAIIAVVVWFVDAGSNNKLPSFLQIIFDWILNSVITPILIIIFIPFLFAQVSKNTP